MADALLSAFLPAVMEKATNYVLEQFVRIWGIQGTLQKMKRMLLAIQDILGDAEERQVKEEGVKSWLAAMKDTAYEADDILDNFNLEAMRQKAEIQVDMMKKVRSFFSLHNPVWFRFKMGRKLNDIVEKIDKLVEEGNKFNFIVKTQPQKRDRPQTHSYVVESEVIGREKEKEDIGNLLLDPKQIIEVLPMVGMGGLGKTTLAQLICQDKGVQKHFQPLIWVCVSDEFDVAKLACKIIAAATGAESGLSNMELLQRRLREVVRGKRYLLVLDDVWNEDREKWDQLRSLLQTGGEGSKIIVTTRSEQVSSIMGTRPAYQPPYLTEDDSWTLFRKRAFEGRAEVPRNLISIGMQIVNKCGGLPLAIKTLGGLMHSKSQEREWLSARDSEIWDMKVGEDGILPALRLSYSHLPSYLKQCFAFCAIFPKDYEMEKDLLIQLWMANGFIPSDGRKELVDKGYEIFNELAWRSFFQDLKEVEECDAYVSRHELHYITTYKMHDLMHDLARSIMGNECLSISAPARWEDVSKKTRHLCISEDVQLNIHGTLNNYPNTRTLLSSIKRLHATIIETDSSKPKSLRALDLHKTTIKRLPIAIRYLKHLRYLDLSDTSIKALPDGTSTLFNLQTLKLSNCWSLSKLPEDMRNMSSLKHLYIDRCHRLKYLPAGIGQLSNLRTLTKYIVGNDDGKRIGELKRLNLGGLLELYNLRNVRDAADAKEANLSSKHNLCSLILCWDMIEWDPDYCYEEDILQAEEDVLQAENAKEVLEALRPPSYLKLLTVWRYGGRSFPTWMMDSQLLQNLVEIHLAACTGCQHLPPLWKLPSLKFLYMAKMDSIQHIYSSATYGNVSNGTVQAFPSLKRLVLDMMQGLEKWCECERTAEVTLVFPCLDELRIINCPNLMTMPELPSIKSLEMKGTNKQLGLVCSLTTLSSLSIHLYRASNSTGSPPLAQKKMSFRYFRSLEKLYITASEDLAPLLEEEEEMRGLSTSLHYLEIDSCNWFFSPSQQSSPLTFWKNLSSLLSLDIQFCDDLVYWPEAEFRGLNSLMKLSLLGCDNLVGPSPLPLSSSSSGDGELLPNLEYLDVVHCDGLLELPKLPASLRSLIVGHCPKLNSLTEGLRHAAALKYVDISGCPSLTSLPVDLGHLTALTWMRICGLPGLNYLPQGLGQLAALKSLDISGCNKLSSLPEGLQGLTALQHLCIQHCPRLSSLPEGLQRRLPGLQHLVIEGWPDLERLCKRGGPYWYLISGIPHTEILSERRSHFSTFHPSFSCFRRSSRV